MEAIEVFKSIIEDSVDKRQQGTRYEYAVKYFLENDPSWANRFDPVWMWADSPTNGGDERDSGIDLVAHDVTDDSYWAIQADVRQQEIACRTGCGDFLGAGSPPQDLLAFDDRGYGIRLDRELDEAGNGR